MKQFKTINKYGDIQVWSLADYDNDENLMQSDYNEYKKMGMIYNEKDGKKMEATHTLIEKKYEKNDAGKWILLEEKTKDYTREKWKTYILGSRDFFRSLGGTETLNGDKLTSISPDRTLKTIRILKAK